MLHDISNSRSALSFFFHLEKLCSQDKGRGRFWACQRYCLKTTKLGTRDTPLIPALEWQRQADGCLSNLKAQFLWLFSQSHYWDCTWRILLPLSKEEKQNETQVIKDTETFMFVDLKMRSLIWDFCVNFWPSNTFYGSSQKAV